MTSVSVLLSTYNGDKYLRQQLDSVLAQQDVQVKLFVRDDGSTDGTVAILEQYSQKGLLTYRAESNVGFAKSFLWLAQNAPISDLYAFCDQDDYWHADKLSQAVSKLSVICDDLPKLYFSSLRVVDDRLRVTHDSTHSRFRLPDKHRIFAASLLQNWVYGCTLVFNDSLRRLFAQYNQPLYCHDWTTYQLAAAFGNVVFDCVPHIDYRQHDSNVFGFYKSSPGALRRSLKLFFQKESKNLRLKEAQKFKAVYYDSLSQANKAYLDEVVNYKKSRKHKRALRRDKAFRDRGIVQLYHDFLLFFGLL